MNITQLYDLYLTHPSVQTDTRKLKEGDIFFALKGPNFNGNQFAAKALAAGAAYAVIDDRAFKEDERYIVMPDVLEALQQLALHHRKQFDIPFIAITGSNGKTTTKELLHVVLKKKYITYATEGNLNNHIGVPLTLLKIGKDAEMAIIEMGANHQREIASYCTIALPTHGIITNCGKAHIEGFGGEEGVRKGKGELYDFLRENSGVVFRNSDLDYLRGMAQGIENQITYGTTNAHYIGKALQNEVFLKVAVLTSGAEMTISTNLVGSYNLPNVMAAVAVGLHFDVPANDVRTAIEEYNPDNSRSQWLQIGSNKVISDAYNANPTSMQAAISNLAASTEDDKMLWLGGMKEMGADERKEHEALIDLINQHDWQQVILVGKEFDGIAGDYLHFKTSAEAAAYIDMHMPQNATILIKGSRGSKMEVLLETLKVNI